MDSVNFGILMDPAKQAQDQKTERQIEGERSGRKRKRGK